LGRGVIIYISLLFLLNATEFKVASYNVENLFDTKYNGTEYPEYIPNRDSWTKFKLDKKLTNISEVICDIDADIIALQEIENLNALKLLQKSLKKYGCDYRYSAITHKQKSAIEVAILSKIAIEKSKDITVTKALGIRNILEIKLYIDGYPIYIFANHWSSQKSSDSKRVLSALKLKKRLDKLPKESEYIILGDLNTHYTNKNIYNILKTARECNMNNNTLFNLWLEKPIYQRWSYNFYGKKQSLDNILIPNTMLDGKGIDYVDNSFDILKKRYLFHHRGYILRWDLKRAKGYSDHLPIFAKFSTKKRYKRANCKLSKSTIKKLKEEDIKLPIVLKRVKVISKDKNRVIIQQNMDKIEIYGLDKSLILNQEYNIIVYKRKFYKNRYEIVDYDIE
jgi:hypothetical protein